MNMNLIENLRFRKNNTNKALFIFFISLFVSFFISLCLNTNTQEIKFTDINEIDTFFHILKNNTVCFIWILSGIFLSRYIVYIYLMLNGLTLGALISKFSNIKYLLLIIPHGVTEMSAFIFTSIIVLNIIQSKKFTVKSIYLLLIAYLAIVLSAIIESSITPFIVSKFIL